MLKCLVRQTTFTFGSAVVLADRALPTSKRASAPTAGEETTINLKTVKKAQELADRLKQVNVGLAAFKSQCEAAANRKRRGSAEEATNLMKAAEEEGPDHQSINLEAPD